MTKLAYFDSIAFVAARRRRRRRRRRRGGAFYCFNLSHLKKRTRETVKFNYLWSTKVTELQKIAVIKSQ